MSSPFERERARIEAVYARRDVADPRYSWFNRAHVLAVQERERHVLDLLGRQGIELSAARVIEFGCGTGFWLREFVKWGVPPANVTGVDLLRDRLDIARRLCPSEVRLICANAATADLDPQAFDIVLQSMLLTSVLDPELRRAVAGTMRRMVRPGGVILSYDYHVGNPANADVRPLSRRDLTTLFPGCRIDLRRVTLAPPLARTFAGSAPWIYRGLASVPWLRTHYLAAITPADATRT